MSQQSQSEKAKPSHVNYLLRCNVPQQVSSQSGNIGLVLKSDTLTRLHSTNIPINVEQDNKSSALTNQQSPQVQSHSSFTSGQSASSNKMDSPNLTSNSLKEVAVMCKNCGVSSFNVQVCTSCSKPLSDTTQAKLRSVQLQASKSPPKRSLIASRFYGGNGLKEFARYVEGSDSGPKRQKRKDASRRAFKTTVADCIMISDSSDDDAVVSVDTSSSTNQDSLKNSAVCSKENCVAESAETKRPRAQLSNDKMHTWQCHAIHLLLKSIHVGQKKLTPTTAMRMSGVGFSVSLEDSIFELKWIAIKLVELSSNPIEPCLYLTINNDCLGSFRSEQGMHPGKFPYYDPEGEADQKYIIFYIDKTWFSKYHHQMRTMLLTFRGNLKKLNSFFREITVNESSRRQSEAAQASLERESDAPPQNSDSSAPKEPSASPELPGMTTRRRHFDTEDKDVTICFSGPRVQLAIYPSPPAKGGIVITNEDEFCLNDHEFLNDVIIDFYLKYTMEELVSESDRSRSHVFSSFFYKRLTQTTQAGVQGQDNKQLSPQERRHARVRNWSRGVDLFSKDFIFIPINDASHWYLAVICFPGKSNDAATKSDHAKPVLEENILDIKVKDVRSLCYAQTARVVLVPLPRASNGNMILLTKQKVTPKADSNIKTVHIDQSPIDRKGRCVNLSLKVVSREMTLKDSEELPSMKETKSAPNDVDSTPPIPSATDEDEDAVVEVSLDGSNATGREQKNHKLAECDLKKVGSISMVKNVIEQASGAKSVSSNHFRDCKPSFVQSTLGTLTEGTPNHEISSRHRPCILIFDSLRGTSRSKTATILREYLTEEWKCRKSTASCQRVFTPANMKMCSPQVPQQDNYSDCGLFLLHYVEKMFQNPIQDFTAFPMRSLQQWFDPNEVKLKRSKIRKVIESLTTAQSDDFS